MDRCDAWLRFIVCFSGSYVYSGYRKLIGIEWDEDRVRRNRNDWNEIK